MGADRGSSVSPGVAIRPTTEELVARARALAPRLRERAQATEELRRIPDETIDEFREAGFFRLFQPVRYGGYELDYGAIQVDLASELGRACGSSAWVQSVVACHAWILGMFPREAQDAVWGRDPDTLLVTAFSTSTGTGRGVDGGYFVRGCWQFASGVDSCQWAILNTPVETQDGRTEARLCLVPRSAWEIVDTWFGAGLRGTGSKDVDVNGTFVPEEHSVAMHSLKGGPTPGSAVNASSIYRLPLLPVFPFNVCAPALGIARGAIEAYVTETARRPDKAGQPIKQMRVSESAAEVDCAELLLRQNAGEIEGLGMRGQVMSVEQRVKCLRDLAFAALLCTRAVDRLAMVMGARGIDEANPVQRAFRDVHAVANHVGVSWDVYAIPYGRVALGLDPGDPRI